MLCYLVIIEIPVAPPELRCWVEHQSSLKKDGASQTIYKLQFCVIISFPIKACTSAAVFASGVFKFLCQFVIRDGRLTQAGFCAFRLLFLFLLIAMGSNVQWGNEHNQGLPALQLWQ